MTTFEILLNNFYDSIEKNRPSKANNPSTSITDELSRLVKKYIDTSFSNGDDLDYSNKLSEIQEKSATLLKNSSFDHWSKIRYAFIENDLHIIRKDRNRSDAFSIKTNLESIL